MIEKNKPDIQKKSKFIPKKITFGKKLLTDMTTSEVKQDICKLLKINSLPEIENVIKNCMCCCHVSTGHALKKHLKRMKVKLTS